MSAHAGHIARAAWQKWLTGLIRVGNRVVDILRRLPQVDSTGIVAASVWLELGPATSSLDYLLTYNPETGFNESLKERRGTLFAWARENPRLRTALLGFDTVYRKRIQLTLDAHFGLEPLPEPKVVEVTNDDGSLEFSLDYGDFKPLNLDWKAPSVPRLEPTDIDAFDKAVNELQQAARGQLDSGKSTQQRTAVTDGHTLEAAGKKKRKRYPPGLANSAVIAYLHNSPDSIPTAEDIANSVGIDNPGVIRNTNAWKAYQAQKAPKGCGQSEENIGDTDETLEELVGKQNCGTSRKSIRSHR